MPPLPNHRRFCVDCGKPLSPPGNFCGMCGTNQPALEETSSTDEAPAGRTPRRKPKAGKILLSLIAVAILSAAGIATIGLLSRSDPALAAFESHLRANCEQDISAAKISSLEDSGGVVEYQLETDLGIATWISESKGSDSEYAFRIDNVLGNSALIASNYGCPIQFTAQAGTD